MRRYLFRKTSRSVAENREKNCLEAVAEYDESLMEKFFEDPDSISAEEIRKAIRAAVIDMSITPMMCGSAFKNKGVQAVLGWCMCFLPSPLDVEAM
jgi:elongation factor G